MLLAAYLLMLVFLLLKTEPGAAI